MASNLIPMLSSSPPPMDENGSFDDEDDDDFGDFTCAGGVKVLDSPINSPVKSSAPSLSQLEETEEKGGTWKKHVETCENESIENPGSKSTENGFLAKDEGTFSEKIVVFSEDVEEFNCDEDEMDFGEEKQGLSAKYAFTHSELHDNTSQESVTDSGLCSSSQRSETSPLPPGEAMFPELSPETETEEVQETFPEDSQLFYLKPDLELPHRSEDEMVADSFEDTTTPVNEPQSFDESLHASQTLDEEEDFQDFESCPATALSLNLEDQNSLQSTDPVDSETVESESRTDPCDSRDADDFADFASAQVDAKEVVSAESCDDSFADFSQVSFDNSSNTEDSDWAKFASNEVGPQNQMPSTSGALQQIPEQFCTPQPGEVHRLLDSAFPETCQGVPDSEQELLPVQSILGNETSHSCLLWRRLEDLDRSVSLQYQWTGSHSFQKTLQSLNIDSRNVVVKPSLFLTVVFQEAIPPAQFDWSSSGLVNPLDPSQSNSTLLDLDFFTNIDTSPSSTSSVTGRPHAAKASSLEQELLGMDPVCGSQSEYISQTGGKDLVQKLLQSVPASSLTGTAGHTLGAGPGTLQLSAQAAGLVSLLPDLSFMQAKVLMFPIRGTLES